MTNKHVLKWKTENPPLMHSTRGHWSPPFSIYESLSTGRCVLTSGGPDFLGPIHTDTLAEAKAQAEVHMNRGRPGGD